MKYSLLLYIGLVWPLFGFTDLNIRPAVQFLSRSEADLANLYAGWNNIDCEALSQKEIQTVAALLDSKASDHGRACLTITDSKIDLLDSVFFDNQTRKYRDAINCELQRNDCYIQNRNSLAYTEMIIKYDLPYYTMMAKWLAKVPLTPKEAQTLKIIDEGVSDESLKKAINNPCLLKKIFEEGTTWPRFKGHGGTCFETIKFFLKMSVWEKYATVSYRDGTGSSIRNLIILSQSLNKVKRCGIVEALKAETKSMFLGRRPLIEEEQNWIARSCVRSETEINGCFYDPTFPKKSQLVEFGLDFNPESQDPLERETLKKYYCHLQKKYVFGRHRLNADLESKAIPVLGLLLGGLKWMRKPVSSWAGMVHERVKVPSALVAARISKGIKSKPVVRQIHTTTKVAAGVGVMTVGLSGLGISLKKISKACQKYATQIRQAENFPEMGCNCESLPNSPISFESGDCQLEIAKRLIDSQMSEISPLAAQAKKGFIVTENMMNDSGGPTLVNSYEKFIFDTFSSKKEQMIELQSPRLIESFQALADQYQKDRREGCL